jgi:hypothetical protein
MMRWSTVFWLAALPCACSSQPGEPSVGADPSAGQGDAGVDATVPPAADGAVDAAAASSDGAASDGASSDGASGGCGEFAGDTVYTCSKDGSARGKCEGDASPLVEACPRGCLRSPPGQDAVCMGTTATFDCTGSYGKTKAANGDYYITAFGCWLDAAGVEHTDPGDNCLPSCFAQAKAAGLCDAAGTGKDCEEKITWYTADAARFGCLARLRVTDPKSGKAVIALALDYGPACSVESSVSKAVLDTSGRIDRYLFGADQGASDKTLVHVVEVDPSTPLGPVP